MQTRPQSVSVTEDRDRALMLYQLISLAGAILILVAFAAQQLRRMDATSFAYQFMNLAGGACLFVAAVAARQYGFILLEGTWTLMSAYGVWRVVKPGA